MKPEEAWRGLQQVNEWIRFADAKAGAAAPLTVATCSLGVSALITLRVLAPRLRTGEARSLVYFDHVARRYSEDREAFVTRYLHLGEDETALCNQLIEQMWANSLVAQRKFRRVALATYALGTAMFAAGAAVIVERL